MKITSLKASGIKGQNISIEPRPVTIITGKNFSGKSAIRDALELALLGYSPKLGKRGQSIFKLSNGEPLEIELSVDGNPVIARRWRREDGSIKSESDSNLEVPAVMLELDDVFGLSKEERLKYFFRLCKAESLTWPKVLSSIKSVTVENPTPETETAIAKVVKLIDDLPAGAVPARLEAAQGAIKEETKKVKQELKDHEGFSRTQARQISELEVPVQNAKRKVAQCRDTVEKSAGETAHLRRLNQEHERMHQELTELESGPFGDVTNLDEQLAELAVSIETAQVEIESAAGAIASMDIESAREKFNELNAGKSRLEAEISSLQNSIKTMSQSNEASKAQSEAQVKTLLSMRDAAMKDHDVAISAANERLAKITAAKCCPTCGANGVTWKDALIESMNETICALCEKKGASFNDFQSKIDDITKALELSIRENAAEWSQCQQQLSVKKSELEHAIGRLEGASIVTRSCDAKQQELNNAQAMLNKLNYDQQAITKQRQQILDNNAKLLANIENRKAELQAIDGDALRESVEKAEQAETVARENLASADKEHLQEMDALSKAKQEQESMMRRRVAEAELEVLKESADALQELQRQEIKSAFEPLLQVVNLFTGAILRAPLTFHEGDLGYFHNGVFVDHKTFSGSEEALAYTGLMVALAGATGAGLRIAVIDEMGRFDPHTRWKVTDRMIALAQDGVIDHACLIDNDDEYYRDTTWESNENVLIHEVKA